MTGEGNGRATVTYEDEETADKAIAEYNGTRMSNEIQEREKKKRPISLFRSTYKFVECSCSSAISSTSYSKERQFSWWF